MKTRVLLADDHTIVRQGLRLVLDNAPDIEVAGEADNGRVAVKMARDSNPDIVLMDLMMPEMNGMEAARQIAKALPKCKVLILSSYSDEDCARQLIAEGIAGYLVKQTASQELLQAIREVRKGNVYFSRAISRNLVERGHVPIPGRKFVPKTRQSLTAREKQVLIAIAQGSPNKAIGVDLGISVKTVEKHRQQVMNKLDIHDAAGLTRYAISTRLIEPNGLENSLLSAEPLAAAS